MQTTSIERASARPTPRWLLRARAWLPIYALILPAVVLTLIPILYMYSTAFTPESEVLRWPIRYIPEHPTLDSFQRLLTNPDLLIGRWLFNSFFVSTAATMLVLFIDSLTAYAFARLQFPGRDALFILVLTTMMIPGQVTLIPTFLIMRDLHWLDTYNA